MNRAMGFSSSNSRRLTAPVCVTVRGGAQPLGASSRPPHFNMRIGHCQAVVFLLVSLPVLCFGAGKGRSFVPSPAIRFAEGRAERGQGTETLSAAFGGLAPPLASACVFAAPLTPEHAEGPMNREMGLLFKSSGG